MDVDSENHPHARVLASDVCLALPQFYVGITQLQDASTVDSVNRPKIKCLPKLLLITDAYFLWQRWLNQNSSIFQLKMKSLLHINLLCICSLMKFCQKGRKKSLNFIINVLNVHIFDASDLNFQYKLGRNHFLWELRSDLWFYFRLQPFPTLSGFSIAVLLDAAFLKAYLMSTFAHIWTLPRVLLCRLHSLLHWGSNQVEVLRTQSLQLSAYADI